MTERLGELLERCKRGDQDAVRVLIKRFGESAQTLAASLLRDEHLGEDAVQEGFLTALRRLGQLRQAEAFPAWFRQIIRSEANRIIRARHEIAADAMGDVPSPDAGPDTQAQGEELRRMVREALGRLSAANHKTAEMFYLDQRSCAEIAQQLQIPRGTVKRRLHDARQQLRDMLLGYIGEQKPTEEPEAPPSWPLPL